MNISDFIAQLRATAKELAPLTQLRTLGALTWNGAEYTKGTESIKPDPYALSWQTALTTIAEMLERQESPMTAKQANYLKHLLFSGMGSLNDLYFDSRSNGEIAKAVNDGLEKQRRVLFDSLEEC